LRPRGGPAASGSPPGPLGCSGANAPCHRGKEGGAFPEGAERRWGPSQARDAGGRGGALKAKVGPGSAALIFFSGFGIQSQRQSYVIPVDAQIWSEADVSRDGVSLEQILADLDSLGARSRSPSSMRHAGSPSNVGSVGIPPAWPRSMRPLAHWFCLLRHLDTSALKTELAAVSSSRNY
jgi:hypothetical protein